MMVDWWFIIGGDSPTLCIYWECYKSTGESKSIILAMTCHPGLRMKIYRSFLQGRWQVNQERQTHLSSAQEKNTFMPAQANSEIQTHPEACLVSILPWKDWEMDMFIPPFMDDFCLYSGWLRNPAPVGRWLVPTKTISWFTMFHSYQ